MDRLDKSKSKVKRIVLKVGTSTLTRDTPRISRGKLEDIAAQIKQLRDEYEIILVSSGAIAAAKQVVELRNAGSIQEKQALASIGQVYLMKTIQEVFTDYDLPVAQCLLTYYDFKNEDSRTNISGTLETLLRYGFLPVVNENDTVATDEIKFGDNDKLAALTAVLCKADILVLATDIDGLYSADPKQDSQAELITSVNDIRPHLAHISDSTSQQGSGGMKSKLEAAQIAQEASIPTWIVNGSQADFLTKVLAGKMPFTKVEV